MTNPSEFRFFGIEAAESDAVTFVKIKTVIMEQGGDVVKEEGVEGASCWSDATTLFVPLHNGIHQVEAGLRDGGFLGAECPVSSSYPLALACCMQLAIKGDAVIIRKTLVIEKARLADLKLDLGYLSEDDTTGATGAAVGQTRFVDLLPDDELMHMIPWILYSRDIEGVEVTLQMLFKHVRFWAWMRVCAKHDEKKKEKNFPVPQPGEEDREWPSLADVHIPVLFGLHGAILSGEIKVSGTKNGKNERAAGGGICSLPKKLLDEFDDLEEKTIPNEFRALREGWKAELQRLEAEKTPRQN